MNAFSPVANELRRRRKSKPGELLLICGIVCIIIAIGIVLAGRNSGAHLARLKSDGVVSQAVVQEKSVRSESYTDRKGRSKIRELYALTLSHDINVAQPYAAWKAGRPFASPQFPAVTTISMDVGQSWYDSLAEGQKAALVRIASDYKSVMLADQLEYETSPRFLLLWYGASALLALVGAVMTAIGWRRRFARIDAGAVQ